MQTILALAAYYMLLTTSLRVVVLAGFFIGILWFYWVGFSFRYYDFPNMQGVVSIFFASVYALYFGAIGLSSNAYIRAIVLFGLSFISIFGFNWMVLELPLLFSYIGILKWQFALVLAVLATVASLRHPAKYALLLLLLIGYDAKPSADLSSLKIKLVQTQIPQEIKWLKEYRNSIIDENFAQIDSAIELGYDIVVLPESTFPLFLNYREDLLDELLQRSKKIAIVTGALFAEGRSSYNVTYIFDNERVQIAKKMVLVPFGEYVPLPDPLASWINDAIFGGASDYVASDTPTYFTIKETTFINAICYEATSSELFAADPSYMIAMSNNGWFTPSIEPSLQRLLMLFYAKKHHTVIYHSANVAGSGIIR